MSTRHHLTTHTGKARSSYPALWYTNLALLYSNPALWYSNPALWYSNPALWYSNPAAIVPSLFCNYKRLASLNESLVKTLKLNLAAHDVHDIYSYSSS